MTMCLVLSENRDIACGIIFEKHVEIPRTEYTHSTRTRRKDGQRVGQGLLGWYYRILNRDNVLEHVT